MTFKTRQNLHGVFEVRMVVTGGGKCLEGVWGLLGREAPGRVWGLLGPIMLCAVIWVQGPQANALGREFVELYSCDLCAFLLLIYFRKGASGKILPPPPDIKFTLDLVLFRNLSF